MNEEIWNQKSVEQIPEELLLWFEELNYPKKYRTGEMIYQEGEQAQEFYYVKKGRIRVFVTSENGMEKTLTVYGEHHIFGEAAFFDGLPRMSSARALTDSQIILLNKESTLLCFRQKPDLALAMIQSLSKTVRMLSQEINQISFLPAERRIASFLVKESEDGNKTITYTHEEIASLIGSTRVTVSRAISKFKKAGWIKTSYREIEVLDINNLEK